MINMTIILRLIHRYKQGKVQNVSLKKTDNVRTSIM